MTLALEDMNRRMLRARDAIDRTYALPLDISNLSQVAHVSEAHFIRTFKATFGEIRTATCSVGASSAPCSCCASQSET